MMKKQGIVALVLAVMAICLLGSCASAPQQFGSDLEASSGESEVTIIAFTTSVKGTIDILVDGVVRQTMKGGDSVKLVLPNGQHSFSVNWHTYYGLIPLNNKGAPLSVNLESQSVVLNMSTPVLVFNKVNLTQTSAVALSGRQRQITGKSPGLEGATFRASETLVNELPRQSTVAVLSVSSRSSGDAGFVVDELEYQFVDSRKFKVVDRKTLDSIRSEQKFQLSGDVDDNSAVDIGRMLGASVVITGSITGSGSSQRLTVKALDVKTAQIITMARESF